MPQPNRLTADKPASKLPHAEVLRPAAGTVVSVSAPSFVLKDNNGVSQTINIRSSTKFYRQGAQKDPAAYEKEMQEFQESLRSAIGATETFVAPLPYELTGIAPSGIAPGAYVLALVGEDGAAVKIVDLDTKGLPKAVPR